MKLKKLLPNKGAVTRDHTLPETNSSGEYVFNTWENMCLLFFPSILSKSKLGGGNSNIFYFHPYLRTISNLTFAYFSNALVQPPTSKILNGKNATVSTFDSFQKGELPGVGSVPSPLPRD